MGASLIAHCVVSTLLLPFPVIIAVLLIISSNLGFFYSIDKSSGEIRGIGANICIYLLFARLIDHEETWEWKWMVLGAL